MTAFDLIVTLAISLGVIPAGVRWLRVLQREHYLGGSTVQFAWRWTCASSRNAVLAVVMAGAVLAAFFVPAAGLVVAAVAVWFPIGLSMKGRTSPLAWTRRLRTVAVVAAIIAGLFIGGGVALSRGAGSAGLVVLCVPLIVDLAAFALVPYERRMAGGFVDQAHRRLQRVSPRIVGITGSFGKTSTKNHIVQLVGSSIPLVATPASFNNTAGLARSVNERLEDGTAVFVAEMGTYGPGEIAAMCAWCTPDVAVMTAIGPVHLERFGSLEVTLASKAEITDAASVVIINNDDVRLAAFATTLEGRGVRVVRCSGTSTDADIAVVAHGETATVCIGATRVDGVVVAPGVQPTNLACAIGVAIELGVDPEVVTRRIGAVTTAANRLTTATGASGVLVIDDTYNANPAGARAALSMLVGTARAHLSVVTPGMIELGPVQGEENEAFGRDVAKAGATLIVVGSTNRAALVRGAQAASGTVIEVATRDDAVALIRTTTDARSAVLYENDLPDHYP